MNPDVQLQQLAGGGWDRESAKAAITTGDWTLLRYTGKVRVRLDPPAPLSSKG